MNAPCVFFLLVSVCAVSGFVDTSGTDRYATKNFFSSKGKKLVSQLQNYFDELEYNFEAFMNNLKGDSKVLSSLNNYKTAFSSLANTGCSAEATEIYEERVKSFVDECANNLPLDEFATFYSNIEVAKGRLKEVDDEIKQSYLICNTSPELHIENVERLLDQLENVLSDEEKAKFKNDSKSVYRSMTEKLADCFDNKTNKFCKDIEEKIKNINTCVNNKL